MKTYLIKYFGCATEKGIELMDAVKKCIPEFVERQFEECGMIGNQCQLDILQPCDKEYDTIPFLISQKKADLVIFDGSIEESDNTLLGDNYKCVSHAPYLNPNVLVVSRTVLPLNFIPHTTNVLPFGENFQQEKDGTIFPVRNYSNQSILAFIKEQIVVNIHNKAKGSNNQQRTDSSVKKDPQLYLSNGEKIAFISYRSHYNAPNKCGNFSVQDLKDHIIDYHKAKDPDEKWKVVFYPPGGLSQDCPTEYLRWALLTYVSNVFVFVDEVWIFDTGNADEKSYWDSWFTQGEFLSLMNIQQGLPKKMPIVRLFNPHTGKSKILEELPLMSEPESRDFSLRTANSDILWGDYAALRNLIFFLNEWKKKGVIKKSLWSLYAKTITGVAKVFWRDLPMTDFNWMSKQRAYQPEFLSNRIFVCPNCLETGHSIDSFRDANFIKNFIHIGAPEYPVAGFFSLDKNEFLEAVEKGYAECPTCHKRIYISRNPSQDFYLWKKRTSGTNPENDWYIEKVPAYSVLNHTTNSKM